MASIRTRLTVTYAAALTSTMLVFGAALWLGRGAVEERGIERIAVGQADAVLRIAAYVQGRDGPEHPTPLVEYVDSLVSNRATRALSRALETVPELVFLFDTSGTRIYASREVRLLDYESVQRIQAAAPNLGVGHATIARDTVDPQRRKAWEALGLPRTESVLLVRRDADRALSPIRTVVVGVPISHTAQHEILGSMLAVAPFILLVSVGVAYYMAGNTLRPLDSVRTELEAITDGRSLHRRLHVAESDDEMARLTMTLNDMIGRLESSFGGLRRFTADASHELKTPLAVLRADVERAMTAPSGSPDQLVALEEALQETTRMANLVDSLLTLARFDEGRFDLHREPVDVEALARDVFETAVILGEAAGLTITLPQCETAVVLGDYARLRQLFLNLVTNAIKYTPAGGTVEVSLRVAEGSAVFAVRDTGIGIAAADLPYIFDRFWRADRARSRRTTDSGTVDRGGFGLGLAISQWIAQAHGGTLAVASRLTRGSTFTVTLPLIVHAPALAPFVEPAPAAIEA